MAEYARVEAETVRERLQQVLEKRVSNNIPKNVDKDDGEDAKNKPKTDSVGDKKHNSEKENGNQT